MTQKLVPNPTLPSTHVVTCYDRTFTVGAGVLDMAENDGAAGVLASAGWTRLPAHGATGERPKNGAPGSVFIDDTLGEAIFAQVWPVGSGVIVGWCDASGNAV